MSEPTAPPPNYGAAVGMNNQESYPQPGVATTYQAPTDPPPKYEPAKTQVYGQPDQNPGGYQSQQPYQIAGPVHQTIIVRQPTFGPDPTTLNCPNCHALVTTQTLYQAGALTWLSAGLICIFGCWMGCCLIPFCVDDLQDVEHRCPNCGRTVGTHVRL